MCDGCRSFFFFPEFCTDEETCLASFLVVATVTVVVVVVVFWLVRSFESQQLKESETSNCFLYYRVYNMHDCTTALGVECINVACSPVYNFF